MSKIPKTSTAETKSSKSAQVPPAISYRLSDKHYMDMGWTSEPNNYVVCRFKRVINPAQAFPVVVMKTKFANKMVSPWFPEQNQVVRKWYPDGKLLYVARPDATGKVFYPNGKLAIKIEKGGINKYRTRIWIFSSGEVDMDGARHPANLCALFDSLGNAVVYDQYLNKRLVYNQREGILWDTPSKVPVMWKWHNIKYTGSVTAINEEDDKKSILPIDPQPVIFLQLKTPKNGEKESKKSKLSPVLSDSASSTKLTKSEIDFREHFEHLRYVNTAKILPREVSPLKPIVLRLNQYMALRIMSQSDITLKFRAKKVLTTFKIGVLYNPYDKLKVVEIDPSLIARERVLCSFENFPANTKSMYNFRKILQKAKWRVSMS